MDHFLTADRTETLAQHQLALAGDPDARAFFQGLFSDDAPCWTCDKPLRGGTVSILNDPQDLTKVLLAPCCRACASLPPVYLAARQMRMLRAMWPNGRWRLPWDKNARGRRVSRRA
jgi:hypothetical protein